MQTERQAAKTFGLPYDVIFPGGGAEVPIYDFQCKACGHGFEWLVRPNDTLKCPACQSRDLDRLLSSFAVTSPERKQAAADGKRKSAADVFRRESFEKNRESERHKHEEH